MSHLCNFLGEPVVAEIILERFVISFSGLRRFMDVIGRALYRSAVFGKGWFETSALVVLGIAPPPVDSPGCKFWPGSGPDGSGPAVRFVGADFQGKPLILDPF